MATSLVMRVSDLEAIDDEVSAREDEFIHPEMNTSSHRLTRLAHHQLCHEVKRPSKHARIVPEPVSMAVGKLGISIGAYCGRNHSATRPDILSVVG